jgi:hypothetical protein
VFDLAMHATTRTLVAGTHGRGMWTIGLADLPSDTELTAAGRLQLGAPVPNPSQAAVALRLELLDDARAEVAIYDAGGRRVRTLHAGALRRGASRFTWDGKDTRGARASAGVYFVRASADGATRVQRLVRLD